jgi:hypothetical protein
MKPRVFIGSSTRSLDIAGAIQVGLHHDADVVVWNQNVFKLGQSNMEALVHELGKSDFGIFVFAPDDVVTMKDQRMASVRDNVIFEFGLFLGKLGRERVFALLPMGADIHLPTDLSGVIFGEYDPEQELVSAVGPFCFQVRQEIKRLAAGVPGSRPGAEARSTEQVLHDVMDDIRSLVQKQLSTQYIGVFPSFLRAHVLPCLRDARTEIRIATNSAAIAYFSDYDSYAEYRRVLKEKRESNTPAKFVLMGESRLDREIKHQFATTVEEWNFLVDASQNAEFQQRLKEFGERILRDISTPTDFYEALSTAESQARRTLRDLLGKNNVVEADIPMPLNVWIADEKTAIFSIPAYGPNKAEYGFETREPNMIVALRAVWQLYRDNHNAGANGRR